MEKKMVLWQARPSFKQMSMEALLYGIGLTAIGGVFLYLVRKGIQTADATCPKVLWVILGFAAIVYYLDTLRELCAPLVNALRTEYTLTSETLFIKVGKSLEFSVPSYKLPSPHFVKKGRGLTDIHFAVADDIDVVLSNISEDENLYKIFSVESLSQEEVIACL